MPTRTCDRCDFERPRFELLDRDKGSILLLCDLCLLDHSISVSEAVKRDLENVDKTRGQDEEDD